MIDVWHSLSTMHIPPAEWWHHTHLYFFAVVASVCAESKSGTTLIRAGASSMLTHNLGFRIWNIATALPCDTHSEVADTSAAAVLIQYTWVGTRMPPNKTSTASKCAVVILHTYRVMGKHPARRVCQTSLYPQASRRYTVHTTLARAVLW